MFTSRLPTSTSVRRPKSMAESTNSFASSVKRPSNIPVSVKKANLFTPQTTKRPFNFGNSTGGKSNFTPFGATTDRKSYISRPTAKPMPDKDKQIEMFDTVIEFLRSNGFSHPLPDIKKFFSSVSTTESSRLLEFLISQIIPDFKISRLEIDVPEALKQLNYPHIRAVTKSALVSVTTRQAVVGLLSIFHWLVLLCNTINSEPELEPIDDTVEASLAFENHIVISYTPPEQLLDKHVELLQKYFPESKVEDLEEETDRLDSEIEQVELEKSEIEGLLEMLRVLFEDVDKCQKYNDDMIQYVEGKKTELKDVLNELDGVENENVTLKLFVDTSPITVDSAKEIHDRFIVLKNEIEEQTRRQQEELTRIDQNHSTKTQETRKSLEEQIILIRASIDRKNQSLKEIREKHSISKSRDDDLIRTKTAYLEKLRVERMKSQSDLIKQGESLKQMFIKDTESIMDNLRKKGAYIDELDQKSKERHQIVKDVLKRLKRVPIN